MPQNDGWEDIGAAKSPTAQAGGDNWEDLASPVAAASGPQPKPISTPKWSDFGSPSEMLGGAATGLENLGSGTWNTIRHFPTAVKGTAKTIGQTYDLAKQGQYIPAMATAAGLVGFDEPRMTQEWNEGHGFQAIGEATPVALADAVSGEKLARRGDFTVRGKTIGDYAQAAKSGAGSLKDRFETRPTANVPFTGGAIRFRIRPEAEPNVQSISESPNYASIQAARKMAREEALTAMKPPAEPGSTIDYEKNARLNRAAMSRGTGRAYDPVNDQPSIRSLPPPKGTPGSFIGNEPAPEAAMPQIDYEKNARLNKAAMSRGTGKAYDPVADARAPRSNYPGAPGRSIRAAAGPAEAEGPAMPGGSSQVLGPVIN